MAGSGSAARKRRPEDPSLGVLWREIRAHNRVATGSGLWLADYAYLENRGCNYVYLQCNYNTGVISDTTMSTANRSKMYDGTLV